MSEYKVKKNVMWNIALANNEQVKLKKNYKN